MAGTAPPYEGTGPPPEGSGTAPAGKGGPVFFFFSNRLGCLGSLVVSVLLSLLLIGLLRLL